MNQKSCKFTENGLLPCWKIRWILIQKYWIYYIWYWRTDRNVKEEREDKLYCAFVLVLKNVVKLVVWLPNTEEHSVRPWLECLWALSQPLAAACQPLWALLCASAGSSPHTPPLPAHTAPPLHVIRAFQPTPDETKTERYVIVYTIYTYVVCISVEYLLH